MNKFMTRIVRWAAIGFGGLTVFGFAGACSDPARPDGVASASEIADQAEMMCREFRDEILAEHGSAEAYAAAMYQEWARVDGEAGCQRGLGDRRRRPLPYEIRGDRR